MLVPELSLRHPEAGIALLQRAFGFERRGGLLHVGSQAVCVTQADGGGGHGRIDHIALAVPDIDAALARMTGQGAALDADVTPDGPQTIPEFWDTGIRYVYLSGPEAARIELCQRNTSPVASAGHDHIGIPCQDLAAMQRFFEAQGAVLVSSVDLVREAVIPVRFLAFAGGMIELYSPPDAADRAPGLWSLLRVAGLSSRVTGPEGVTLAPL